MKKTLLSAAVFGDTDVQAAATAIQQVVSPNQMTVLTDEQMDQVGGGIAEMYCDNIQIKEWRV